MRLVPNLRPVGGVEDVELLGGVAAQPHGGVEADAAEGGVGDLAVGVAEQRLLPRGALGRLCGLGGGLRGGRRRRRRPGGGGSGGGGGVGGLLRLGALLRRRRWRWRPRRRPPAARRSCVLRAGGRRDRSARRPASARTRSRGRSPAAGAGVLGRGGGRLGRGRRRCPPCRRRSSRSAERDVAAPRSTVGGRDGEQLVEVRGRGLEGLELRGVDRDLRRLRLDGLGDLDGVGGDLDRTGPRLLDLGGGWGPGATPMSALPPSRAFADTADHRAHAHGERRDHGTLGEAGGVGDEHAHGAGRAAACRPPAGRPRNGILLLTRNTLSSSDGRP